MIAEDLQLVGETMRKLGFQGEVTENTVIPADMVESLTDELALKIDKTVSVSNTVRVGEMKQLTGVLVSEIVFE